MILKIYQCDCCDKVLDNGRGQCIPHLSLQIEGSSGLFEPNPNSLNGNWRRKYKVSGNRQFCNSECVAGWIVKQIGKLTEEEKAKEEKLKQLLDTRDIDY